MIGRAGLGLRVGADEGEFLDARDVVGVGAVIIAAGQLFLVEPDEHTHVHGLLREAGAFLLAAVAPIDDVGLAAHQRRDVQRIVGFTELRPLFGRECRTGIDRRLRADCI